MLKWVKWRNCGGGEVGGLEGYEAGIAEEYGLGRLRLGIVWIVLEYRVNCQKANCWRVEGCVAGYKEQSITKKIIKLLRSPLKSNSFFIRYHHDGG